MRKLMFALALAAVLMLLLSVVVGADGSVGCCAR
jgi:hypothetical protein